jgi:Cu(I)/Ag(I) efflux system membrane protein CusA/SilA
VIGRLVEWSTRNVGLVLFLTAGIVAAGLYALHATPVDAIPDLSDTQVIVYTDFPGQSPQVVEDQVTFPLSTAFLSVPGSRVVRGFSFFGVSFVYVIFEDGTDLYWARSRVLEYLNAVAATLPDGAQPRLGPDATGVGWIFQYALTGGGLDLAELRSLQDWQLRFRLAALDGVSEVASVGGQVRQYQVTVDPLALRALGLSLDDVATAIKASNSEVGGRTLELAEREYMIRGLGYLRGLEDLRSIPVSAARGTPVLLGDIATLSFGPEERRGLAELDGRGEVVSGIVVKRDGENALAVIERVKRELEEISRSLPEGVAIETVYDRSGLIERSIATLRDTRIEESLVVLAVCFVFLLHARSALVAIVTLPVGVLIAFLAMHLLGIGSNIMSLGGIAIAIGAMIDAAIVMIENAHKHVERAGPGGRRAAIVAAAREVGAPLFFTLLVITVSFLPVFTLEAQEGRLFKPLAYTKTFAMAAAALLSVTLVPALMVLLLRGRMPRERSNPVNVILIAIYRPLIRLVLRARVLTVLLACLAVAISIWPWRQLGSEFMPDIGEGTLMFMPVTLPGISVTAAADLLQTQNRIIASFPEVERVLGKAGRAATATDPAPLEMAETLVVLKPPDEWRPDMTLDRLIREMDTAVTLPGVSNAWTMPIRARIDMLSTGIRTPIGIKVYGPDLAGIEEVARAVEASLREVPGTASAFAERTTGGYFLDIVPDRAALARLGLTVGDFQETVAMALGGESLLTTVEGRQRYSVNLRYARSWRSDPEAIANDVLVHGAGGMAVPLGQVAAVKLATGPTTLRTENAQLVSYIFVDIRDRDLGGYVAEAQQHVAETVTLPSGFHLEWSGQFEFLERSVERLTIVIPATLAIIFLLLYLNFRRLTETLIVLLSIPFAMTGGLWLTWWMGFNLSVAVAVGFIALAGVAAETGVIMLLYLDQAWRRRQAACLADGRFPALGDLHGGIMEGAVERVRPKAMTVTAIVAGLVPILWNHGAGSEVMQRIAVPMIGGMASSAVLTLLVIPALYALFKGRELRVRAAPGRFVGDQLEPDPRPST